MKKLFLLLLILLPTMTFSQVSSWRSSPPQSQRTMPNNQMQGGDISLWRNDGPRDFNRPRPNNTRPNVIIHDPWLYNGWGWNRWDMWGAPGFGWNYSTPMWYHNDWGYRQPARVYVYDDGKIDTVRGKKPILNFGIQQTTNQEIGGFFTIGNKSYFITEFNTTFERDNSVKRQSFYVGVGKRIKRTGIHMMIGGITENVRWRGKDDVGYITFPKYINRFTAVKVGLIHDHKNFTTKIDYNPTVNNWTFGLGINF